MVYHKRKFKEKTKVLGLRVPISQYDNYKKLFASIIKDGNGTLKFETLELFKLGIMEKDSFIHSIDNQLKKNGNLTYNQFDNLLKNVDMDIIQEVDKKIKKEG